MLKLVSVALTGGLLTAVAATSVLAQSAPQAAPRATAQAEPPVADLNTQRSAVAPFWAKRLTGYLKTRDGEELRYSALLPKGKGPFPVLLHFSGYAPGSIGGSAYLEGRGYPRSIDKQFLDAGYAVIGVNRRATGCSTGSTFDWHHPLYGQDGYDAVEFAAAQPWSNGAVGMYSWSWPGMAQLWTAATRPPHLKAIAPGHVIADPRADSYAPGGVPQPSMISGWGSSYVPNTWTQARDSALAENDTRCVEQIDRNLKTLEAGSPGRLVLAHPFKDAHQEERTPARRAHLINVPVLSLTSFQDGATTSRGGYYQWNVDPKLMWMIDTNGNHSMYMSEVYRKDMVRFFDRFVKGKANGFEETPRLQVWQEAAVNPAAKRSQPFPEGPMEQAEPNFVVTRPTITPEVKQVSFTLSEGGRLTENGAPSTGSQTFKYPVASPSVLGPRGWGDLNPDWKNGSLVFTTAPLERDIVPYGPASADLWISSASAPDADLQVTVTAVLPDGKEMYVQRGWLRLSNRALDTEKSTAGRPVLLDKPEAFAPMMPNRPELVRLEVNRFSYPFRKGTRLRIWIETPGDTGTYQFSYNPVPTTLKLWHDADHTSKFVINVLENEPAPKAARGCGEVLDQPCRADPLAG
ncbi:CocE/NonD family hydrolase [Phenylobacterium sp.]|jgi:putative CocE/NonD family hydrolase|uniref:CocE/NonD family hydrolase n=1 Tax=Phenylobacterium sp. TaxID=1871053 RepID=UPI003784725B